MNGQDRDEPQPAVGHGPTAARPIKASDPTGWEARLVLERAVGSGSLRGRRAALWHPNLRVHPRGSAIAMSHFPGLGSHAALDDSVNLA
jgi:hypothetical protein